MATDPLPLGCCPVGWCIGCGLIGGLILPGTYCPINEPSSVNCPPNQIGNREQTKLVQQNSFSHFLTPSIYQNYNENNNNYLKIKKNHKIAFVN